ncbi:low temperature requirement protein A [Microbispora rosea]
MFDLVFVFAVTQLSASLHADHSLAGLDRALVLFVPVYWVWVSTSVYTNTCDVDNAVDRFGILAAGLDSLVMTLAIPGRTANGAMPFATSYLTVRTLLLVLVARTRGWFANPFSVAVFVAAPLRPAGTALGALCLLVVVVVAVDVWEYAACRRG